MVAADFFFLCVCLVAAISLCDFLVFFLVKVATNVMICILRFEMQLYYNFFDFDFGKFGGHEVDRCALQKLEQFLLGFSLMSR